MLKINVFYIFRRLGSVSAAVQRLCTLSTWALYSEYMAFVLRVHGPCTLACRSAFRRLWFRAGVAKGDFYVEKPAKYFVVSVSLLNFVGRMKLNC